MKPHFQYDGTYLQIRIVAEDESEIAVLRLFEKLTQATVRLDYGDSSMYHYRDHERPKAVEITLGAPPEPAPAPYKHVPERD